MGGGSWLPKGRSLAFPWSAQGTTSLLFPCPPTSSDGKQLLASGILPTDSLPQWNNIFQGKLPREDLSHLPRMGSAEILSAHVSGPQAASQISHRLTPGLWVKLFTIPFKSHFVWHQSLCKSRYFQNLGRRDGVG